MLFGMKEGQTLDQLQNSRKKKMSGEVETGPSVQLATCCHRCTLHTCRFSTYIFTLIILLRNTLITQLPQFHYFNCDTFLIKSTSLWFGYNSTEVCTVK